MPSARTLLADLICLLNSATELAPNVGHHTKARLDENELLKLILERRVRADVLENIAILDKKMRRTGVRYENVLVRIPS